MIPESRIREPSRRDTSETRKNDRGWYCAGPDSTKWRSQTFGGRARVLAVKKNFFFKLCTSCSLWKTALTNICSRLLDLGVLLNVQKTKCVPFKNNPDFVFARVCGEENCSSKSFCAENLYRPSGAGGRKGTHWKPAVLDDARCSGGVFSRVAALIGLNETY